MKILKLILLLILGTVFSSCKDYLDAKPDQKLAVPSDKLKYLQLLLNNTNILNTLHPASGDLASDDVFITDVQWNALLQNQKTSANAYIWDRDLFNENDINDWSTPYRAIFYANLVLDGLEELKAESGSQQWKEIRGAALFYRSYAYYNLLQTFAKGYDRSTANTDPGVVLKLSSDVNENMARSSVQQCYDLLIKDTEEAKLLLPKTILFKTSPGMTAAAALLARAYLTMKIYDKALKNAEEALSVNSVLIDFNSLNAGASFPLSRFNSEVIYHSTIISLSGFSQGFGAVSNDLYGMYSVNDIRRSVFYKVAAGDVIFKGNYSGANTRFNGLANNELYLIAAEGYARTNNATSALNKLNSLLVKRWRTGTFTPISETDNSKLIKIILDERRKELAFRNIRWSDLKRLNQEPDHQKIITKTINNKTYTLIPGDKRYLMPIPLKVIATSGIAQN